ncbi:MAG: ABC transporter substrate-binding protein [Thermoanaerobaculia bacterium]|nr:ABC transporter substrate-binding protein [Thermoanaerobaculia bacterium]
MIGQVLSDRYEITGELGRGGMGVVYRAWDPLLQRDVAVKMIPPARLDEESEQRIRREARTVARLDHPGIVPIHDLGQHERSLFLVMPLVRGDTLRSLIRSAPLTLGELLEVGAQAARALAYSHSRGVVHRDVKPSNVLVAREGEQLRVRLMDFGLAQRRSSESGLTRTGNLPGTLAYLSPEQVEENDAADPLDGRSDIYSLGTLLYECMAGEPPFTGTVYSTLYRILHEAPQPLRSRGIDIDPRLEGIILRCLSKDRNRRPASGDELADELEDHRRQLSEAARQRSTTLDRGRLRVIPIRRLPLIGRDEELAQLQECLKMALAGECQLVVLGGEAGTGKTRLLQELEAVARSHRVRVLRGRFSEFESAFPFQGLCDLIQDYFRTRRPSSSSAGAFVDASDAEPELGDLAPDLVSLFPELSEVPELRHALETSSPVLARELLRETRPPAQRVADPIFVFELLARTLVRLGGGWPLVLVQENLHAAEVAIEALQYLVRRLGSTPTLIVGTYRPSETVKGHPLQRLMEGFATDPRFRRLELRALSRNEVEAQVSALVGSKNMRGDLVERIYEATEGNPLFTQELVQGLLESGAMARDETGVYGLADYVSLGTSTLPATIQQAEERRIERLEPEQRSMLSVAAVLGKSFGFTELEALAESAFDGGCAVDELVDELVSHGLLVEDRKSRGDRLTFASGVLRDLLYQELSRRRRRSLHRIYARRLEERYSGRLERVLPQLVDHFRAADEADATVRYGLALARRSLDSFSPEDAVRAARVALEFVEEEEVERADRLLAELTGILAAAYRDLGRLGRSLQEAERATEAWGRVEEEGDDASEEGSSGEWRMDSGDIRRPPVVEIASLARLGAEVAWQARRMEDVRRWVERGVPRARFAGDMECLRRLLELGVTISNLRGEPPPRGWVQELRSLSEGRVEGGEEQEARQGGSLVTALATPLVSVDPGKFLFMEEWEVGANVFETLLGSGSDGLVVAGLCDKWSSSDDGQLFHFTLRPDLLFSDGEPVDAAAVKASLERSVRLRADLQPPAFEAIAGVRAFLAGSSDTVSGIEIDGGDLTLSLGPSSGSGPPASRGLVFRLREKLPIFPALLTDLRTAVVRDTGQELLGTGPFRFVNRASERVVLEENPHWRGQRPRIDRLEFRVFRRSSEIAAGLQKGEIDVGRDLRSDDLEELLRRPKLRPGLVETVKKNTYFALFNPRGPWSRRPEIRRVLARSVPVLDLVWRSLGRFAMPAIGLIPPGVLGHDAGRRPESMRPEDAVASLEAAGFELPLRLAASVHPLFRDRFGPFLQSLVEIWSRAGLEVSIEVEDVKGFVRSVDDPEHRDALDLLIARWNPAYDDPDNYTWALVNRESGIFRNFFDLPEATRILDSARRERRPGVRQNQYRQFQDLVEKESALLPLFHDIDYRVVAPKWKGIQLSSSPPFVSYSDATRSGSEETRSHAWPSGGEIHVPTPADLHVLDAAEGHLLEHHDVLLNVFETLTRLDDQVQVQPWLAESLESLHGGRLYRVRLRQDVRFHDGRRMTARDVRWSFERLLRVSDALRYLLQSIRGAPAMARGDVDDLAGLVIESPHELRIELDRPLAFFPVLLSHPATVIVPENTESFDGHWRDGCCGTGPFRVVSFDVRERLDLERFPDYWREGSPRCERLVFHRETDSEQIATDFRGGRLSLAGHLSPEDLESLRRDPAVESGRVESPSLATYFLAANSSRGVLSDTALRHSLFRAIDRKQAVTESMGRLATRAQGLLPPGLLGYESPRVQRGGEEPASHTLEGLQLSLALHPIFVRTYSSFASHLVQQLESLGIRLNILELRLGEFDDLARRGEADLLLARWVAVYPDADCFFSGLWQSQSGLLRSAHRDVDLERLVEQARTELDPALRHALYRSAEDHIHRQALLLPLFHEQNHRLAGPGVAGLRLGITLPVVRYDELAVE